MVFIIFCTFAALACAVPSDQCGIHSRRSDMIPAQLGIRPGMEPSLEFPLPDALPMPRREDSPILMPSIRSSFRIFRMLTTILIRRLALDSVLDSWPNSPG